MPTQSDRLLVVWTSGDKEVAKKMVFMYTRNSMIHGWWPNVTLLVWGPSAQLVINDLEIQDELKLVQEAGVTVIACKSCAEKYEIVPKLETLGIDVFYTGEFITNWIRSGDHLITF